MVLPLVWPLGALPFVLLYWLLTLTHQDQDGRDFGLEDVRAWVAKKCAARVPKRPAPADAPPPLPQTVTRLAEAAAGGADCAYALHDALLEAGRPDLAACFSGPQSPAASRAIDQILGGWPAGGDDAVDHDVPRDRPRDEADAGPAGPS